MEMMTIGIYGISSQSGRAFLADYLTKGIRVIGYTRPTQHGLEVLDAIHQLGGLYLERPENSNKEQSHFAPMNEGCSVTADLEYMVSQSDIIIIALPSTFQEEAVKAMNEAGLWRYRVPIVLSPSRSVDSGRRLCARVAHPLSEPPDSKPAGNTDSVLSGYQSPPVQPPTD